MVFRPEKNRETSLFGKGKADCCPVFMILWAAAGIVSGWTQDHGSYFTGLAASGVFLSRTGRKYLGIWLRPGSPSKGR